MTHTQQDAEQLAAKRRARRRSVTVEVEVEVNAYENVTVYLDKIPTNDLLAELRDRQTNGAEWTEDEDRLLDESDQADDDYNRSKDELFCAMRELMGWPGRPAKYLPEHLGGGPVLPHTFEQEGPE